MIGEDIDLQVGLHDGHLDVERRDFVGQALPIVNLCSNKSPGTDIRHKSLPWPIERHNIRPVLGCLNGQLWKALSLRVCIV